MGLMGNRKLPFMTRFALAAHQARHASAGQRDERRAALLRLLSEPAPAPAPPTYWLLCGAASSWCYADALHPAFGKILLALDFAVDAALLEPPPMEVKYTGGALRHYEREDDDARA